MTDKTLTFENAPEQKLYAKILHHTSNFGLLVLISGFTLYVLGAFSPLVSLEELPQYWSLSLTQFQEKTGSPTGWRWLSMLRYGDVIPLLGIVVLASVTFVSYLVLFFQFLQRRAKPLVLIVTMELFFMLLSASNLIQISH